MKRTNKKITMQDIADQLNLSRNTISRALLDKDGISDEVKQKVIKTANSLGYEKKVVNLKKKQKRICVITCRDFFLDQTYFAEIFLGIEEISKIHDIFVNFLVLDDDSNKINHQENVLGFIIAGKVKSNIVKMLSSLTVPKVYIDFEPDGSCDDVVIMDNEKGLNLIFKELIKKGHKEIGFIGNRFMYTSFQKRYQYFLSELRENNLKKVDEYILTDSEQPYWQFGVIKNELKKMTKFPTAFICINDRTAFALMQEIDALGLRIPEDISVIGFDNVKDKEIFSPSLTTVNVYKGELGRVACSLLLQKIKNKNSISKKILVDVSLIEKNSVKMLGVIDE
ncbi:MAG: LacI family DNA-binding transcriptional regulator [Sphaerochaetaceae bacterium]|nr:LacI family DNA-binding transcriptional regulator [Sphaerochaetaceae bacterium]